MPSTEISRVISQELFVPTSKYEIDKINTRKGIDPLVERGLNHIIHDEADKVIAVNLGQVLTVAKKEVVEQYKPVKQSIDAVKKQVLGDESFDVDRIEAAQKVLSTQILTWDLEQNRKRLEAEQLARELAQIEEDERKLREAIELEREGDTEGAKAVLEEESLPVPAIIQKQEKVKGQVNRTQKYAEVTDKKQLIEAVAAGLVPLEAVEINQSFLNNQAKYNISYPGVVIHDRKSVSFRS